MSANIIQNKNSRIKYR